MSKIKKNVLETKNTTTTEAINRTYQRQSTKEMAAGPAQKDLQTELADMIIALRNSTRTVNNRLENTQRELLEPVIPELKQFIDNNAAYLMNFCASNSMTNSTNLPSTRKGMSASLNAQCNSNGMIASQETPKMKNMMWPALPANDSSDKVYKSRKVLTQEIEALQSLIMTLTLHNPGLKTHIMNLAQSDMTLSKMNMFRIAGGGGGIGTNDVPTCSRYLQNNHYILQEQLQHNKLQRQCINGKVHHDSMRSNTSNQSNDSKERKQRKRNRKAKVKNEQTTLQSELEAMRKYINNIVMDYLGQNKLEEKYKFNGDFSDLEQHAKLLTDAGMGRIVEENIRINRKNNRQAFIAMSNERDTTERDGIVHLPVARRYAFEDDIVRAFVFHQKSNNDSDTQAKEPKGTNKSACENEDAYLSEESASLESDIDNNDLETHNVVASNNCPKAFVIAVVKRTELRQIVGTISFSNPVNLCYDKKLFYKLRPHDMRVPMVYVSKESCAIHMEKLSKEDICGMLFVAHILEIDSNGHCIAELLHEVGRIGNMEAEIKALLYHNSLHDITPYEERFNKMFEIPDPPISEAELEYRMDLRKTCIFTIDPLTARDLDDAISIDIIGPNIFKVGVHISDVAHYLKENSELDNIVKERSTSIYLVNEVIHMLPETLCLKCSLLPGVDKFAFSVFWHLDEKGVPIDNQPPIFTRSVINSCTQFAYEHVQHIIDNCDESFDRIDFPTIVNDFTPRDIVKRVLWLNKMAIEMRKRRFTNGALSINNPKIRFVMDPQTGEPQSFAIEKLGEANHLIEEFMLFANQAVAKFIYEKFPNISILRNHEPPLTKSLQQLHDKLELLNIKMDFSSAKSIYESLRRIVKQSRNPLATEACLSQLLMKPMARAKYFCSDGRSSASCSHYALSIPIYTHFTSPIRRYPDILVHRVLAAALKYTPPPTRTVDELIRLAKLANDRKYSAKMAGDDSSMLFFKRYIQQKRCIRMEAVVMEIFQYNMNVVTLESGHVIPVTYKMQNVMVNNTNAPQSIIITERNSKLPPVQLQLMSTVGIKVMVVENRLQGFLMSPDPKQAQINSKCEMQKIQHQNGYQNGYERHNNVSPISDMKSNGQTEFRKQKSLEYTNKRHH